MRSIINQDFQNKEVILIDGGSAFATLEALKEYSKYFSYFVSERDDGIYSAMNKGLLVASGEWILFMNIGDRFHTPEVLSKLIYECEVDDSIDMVYGDSMLYHSAIPIRRESVPRVIKPWFLYKGMICHQSMMVKASVFNKIGQFNTNLILLSDKDWLFRYLKSSNRYKHVMDIICDWDVRGISSDTIKFKKEWSEVVHTRYSKAERLLYCTLWAVRKSLIYMHLI